VKDSIVLVESSKLDNLQDDPSLREYFDARVHLRFVRFCKMLSSGSPSSVASQDLMVLVESSKFESL